MRAALLLDAEPHRKLRVQQRPRYPLDLEAREKRVHNGDEYGGVTGKPFPSSARRGMRSDTIFVLVRRSITAQHTSTLLQTNFHLARSAPSGVEIPPSRSFLLD